MHRAEGVAVNSQGRKSLGWKTSPLTERALQERQTRTSDGSWTPAAFRGARQSVAAIGLRGLRT